MLTLKPGKDKPVRNRHPWIFSGAIARIPEEVADGDIVEVHAANGEWLARGYLNRRSQIQVRILTWRRDEAIDEAFWRARIATAVAGRANVIADTNALRLINAESDYLPGLTVDRYGDYLVLQAGTLAIERSKQVLARILLDVTGARGIIERSEMAARRQEGLQEASGLLLGDAPEGPVEVYENGQRFLVDLLHGQKTGFYTDQRTNRQRVATYCAGKRVLNAFSYTGGFALHALAAGASHVSNIDSSIEALEIAEQNLQRNGYDEEQYELIAGDVFQYLRELRSIQSSVFSVQSEKQTIASQPTDYDLRITNSNPRLTPHASVALNTESLNTEYFDVIILDPPKFASSQAQLERALRGYKEINLSALRLLSPGGILATFSCSGLVSADLFQKVVFGAAVDAGRQVQILEWLRQDADHPVAITFPEGEYLKGLICRVL